MGLVAGEDARIAVLAGGSSSERDISLASGGNVVARFARGRLRLWSSCVDPGF